MKKYLYIAFLLIFGIQWQFSIAQFYNSLNISRKDGLSDSNVKAICVDHFGYVWIGTDHGLNRYDGFETITYYHDINDNSTLNNNKISRIYEDREGEIWVITPNGVNFFNRQSGVFQRILMGFSRIAYESEAEIWFIQSNRIIYIYDKASQIITQHAIQFDGEELSADQFSNPQVCDFDERYLLLSIWNRGLYLLEKNNKMLIPYFNLPIENCTGLFVLNGNIWISSYFSGIYKINIENDSIVHYTANNSAICNSIILDFKKSSDTNSIWIATDGSGIQEFNEDFELLNHYEAGSGVNKPLPDNSIQTLYFGDEGNVWAGSVRSGAVLLYPDFIEYFPNKDNSPAGPSNKVILRGFEDREGNIWLGTDGGGLNRFTPSNYIFKQYLNKSAAKITGAIPFSKDKILLSSYMGQLFFFDTKKLIYSTAHNHPLFREIEIRKNYRLFKDSKKNIWIWDNRLWKINIEKNSAELISKDLYPDLFSQISASFHCVFEDTIENILWFGARGGFYAFDFDKNKITNLVVLNKVRDMYGSDVYSIIVGKDSKIIFGTSKGLFRYDPESDSISNFFRDNKYNNIVFKILFKVNGVLWAGTSKGLLKIETGGYPQNVINYFEGDFDFSTGAIIKSSDKKIYLGTSNGLVRFYPEKVEENTLPKRPIITSFNLIGTQRGSEIPTTLLEDVLISDSLKIPFSNSVYKFNFNSFNIPFQDKTNYSYLLEGFEENWHVGPVRTATYTNLSPGEYTFLVKASSKTGIWDDRTAKLKFEVMPLWWQTVWFKIVVSIIVFLIAALIWMATLKRTKLKYLLEAEKKEQERLKEVNQMKLRFFTNISHELRTPLTLIYTPLKKMVSENVSLNEIKKGLSGLYRNVSRMKDLVDQILEFRKAEMDELHFDVGRYDFIDYCSEIIDSFSYMAQIEGIELDFKYRGKTLFFDFDRDKISKIMFNLISNALKYSKKGGFVTVKARKNNGFVYISVSDTGKGIPEANLSDIFDRYYQVEPNVAGSGIGLALTKKLVELHSGEIWADSKLGKGSIFTIKVPQEQEQLTYSKKEEKPEEVIDIKETSEESIIEVQGNESVSLLIIEDDWELRNYLAIEFKDRFIIYTASNGREGFEKTINELPDLIISDVMMPEMDGYEFCKLLRADLRVSHTPVILLTAKAMDENMVEGYKSGADLYVPKPFDKDILLSQIQSLLTNRELLKKRYSHDLEIKIEDLTHSDSDEKLLHKAISIVEMNIQNTQFDVNRFVEELGIGRTLAYKKIKVLSGKSINDFILLVRLQKAGNLLKKTEKTVAEIALEVGFSDHSYFSAVFKKQFNTSPTSFRKSHLNQ